jgi:2,5-diamino-6-(ribosylamino)-4(3H)-pyrimidinone 5'-phosphate reductase
MVGIGTAKADNPGLCTRYSEDGVNVVGLEKQPRPFVLDPRGRWRLEDTPKLFGLAESGEGRAPWWITRLGEENLNAGLFEKIHDVGGGVIDVGEYGGKDAGVDWGTVLRRMAENGITSVMIEGGGAVCGLSHLLLTGKYLATSFAFNLGSQTLIS